MKRPIDDERVRRAIAMMRASAFAIASGMLVAGLLVARERAATPVIAAIMGLTVGTLGWVAARGRAQRWLFRMGTAGALMAPACLLALGVIAAIRSAPTPGETVDALVMGATASVCLAPFGFFAGCVFGSAFLPVWLAHARLEERPAWTSGPSALCAAATWCAVVLELAALGGATLGGAAWISLLIAVGAALEMLRRAAFVRRVVRGAVAGWHVERDDDGTRWMMRETRRGEGAYREGVLSQRWGRA